LGRDRRGGAVGWENFRLVFTIDIAVWIVFASQVIRVVRAESTGAIGDPSTADL